MKAITVQQWLAGEIGLDASTLGPQAVANAVKRRMAALNLTKESDYLERLYTAPGERPALIELIVVPETWFFRDREPFVFLAKHVKTTWLTALPKDRLRVLSVPCSSGEEPYSIAMTLLAAGLPPDRFGIDAVDINPAMLQKAAKGVYGPNSFRSGLLPDCERYFTSEGAARLVDPIVRDCIRFIQGNIMGTPDFAADQTYDVVFCRNLLIYQHMQARAQIIATLDRLLKPEGLLFVGHAEMMPLLSDRYVPARHNSAFAYCKTKTKQGHTATEAAATGNAGQHARSDHVPADLGGGRTSAPRQAPAPAAKATPAASPLPESRPEPSSRLDVIRVLADQGRLGEAAAMCRDLLQSHPQLAQAHFLLGVIRTAEGQVQAAEECLNRALYLDAEYYDALIHLSLLKARRGDEEGAARLRRRAERVRDHSRVTT